MTESTDSKEEPSVPEGFFKDVKFYLIGNIDEKIKSLLLNGGAKQEHYMSEMITHAIAEDPEEDDYNEAKELFELTTVTTQWVLMSLRCRAQLPVKGFSPDANSIFAGVVACPSKLAASDAKNLWAMITFHGGKCQRRLDKNVTHLIVPDTEGAKYECALKHEDITIVMPDWVVDCVKEKKKVDADRYHPQLIIKEEPKPPTPSPEPEPIPMLGGATRPQDLPLGMPRTPTPGHSPGSTPGPDSPKTPNSKTKEALARMISSRTLATGRGIDDPNLLRQIPGLPTSPRAQLRGVNSEQKSPSARPKVGMPMAPGMPRPPRQMSPGRSALAQQLQQNMGLRQQQQLAQIQQMQLAAASSHEGHPRPPFPMQPQQPQQTSPQQQQIQPQQQQQPPGAGGQIPQHLGPQQLQQLQQHHAQQLQQQQHQLQQQQQQQREQQLQNLQQHQLHQQQLQQQLQQQQQLQMTSQANAMPPHSHAGPPPPQYLQHQALLKQQEQQQKLERLQQLRQQQELKNKQQQLLHQQQLKMQAQQQQQQMGAKLAGASLPPPGLPAIPVSSPSAQQTKPLQRHSIPTPDIMPIYYGHDPVESGPLPEELCLLGCVFYIVEYQKYLDAVQFNTWKNVIEQHGGEVAPNYSNRTTHVVCETQRSDIYHVALRDEKRIITAHWLNDVLTKKKMLPPYQALHFPLPYATDKPCSNQVVCVTNFEGEERTCVKRMISTLGAKYTGFLTHNNSVLVCKKPEGVKYNKAREWRIPVVNVEWLNDLLLDLLLDCRLKALKLPVHEKYQQFNTEEPFKVDMWRVTSLMVGWKQPVRISKEAWQKYRPTLIMRQQKMAAEKRKQEERAKENAKKPRLEPAYSLNGEGVPVVLFTGFSRMRRDALAQHVERLGGHVAYTAKGATHLVTEEIARTMKFFTAMSVVKHVVTPAWVEHSALENKFLDENNFVLRDAKHEAEFDFKLHDALLRARTKPVFQDLTFWTSPSVVPSLSQLKEVIENGGGTVVTKRPTIKTIRLKEKVQGGPGFIVISSEDDLDLCEDLRLRKIPVYHIEFVLMGALRQQINFGQYQFTS